MKVRIIPHKSGDRRCAPGGSAKRSQALTPGPIVRVTAVVARLVMEDLTRMG